MGNFGERLKSLLDAYGWSQKDFADRAGIAPCLVCKYSKGEIEPKLSSLVRMADALDIPLDELVGRGSDDGKDMLLARSLIAEIERRLERKDIFRQTKK